MQLYYFELRVLLYRVLYWYVELARSRFSTVHSTVWGVLHAACRHRLRSFGVQYGTCTRAVPAVAVYEYCIDCTSSTGSRAPLLYYW